MAEDRIIALENRMAKIEGILEQINLRLTEVKRRLAVVEQTKADKWKLRLWFIFITTILGVILARLFVL